MTRKSLSALEAEASGRRVSVIRGVTAATPQRLRPLRRALTSENLFESNLIDGVVDPLDSERSEGKP